MNQSHAHNSRKQAAAPQQTAGNQAVDALMVRTREALLNAAYRFFQSGSMAQDAVLETYEQVHLGRSSAVQDQELVLWRHFCQVCLKKELSLHKGRSKSRSGADHRGCQQDFPTPVAAMPGGAGEVNSMLRKAIAELGAQERMVLILDHWEKRTPQDISTILRRPQDEVQAMLYCARAKCRIKLQPYLSGE